MKDLNIEAPEGYMVDEANSDLAKGIIKFKTTKDVVKDWEDLENKVSGYYIDTDSLIESHSGRSWHSENRNLFADIDTAVAARATAMLTQLVKATNGDWLADYSDGDQTKYTIERRRGEEPIIDTWWTHETTFLAFKTRELAQEFKRKHRELIKDSEALL